MPNATPAITVLLPVYNGLPYLEAAIRSILQQSFEDFTLLIVDDGSSDGSRVLLEKLAKTDARIELIFQQNAGIVLALNRGLDAVRSPYVARMDADDVALPQRLERQ